MVEGAGASAAFDAAGSDWLRTGAGWEAAQGIASVVAGRRVGGKADDDGGAGAGGEGAVVSDLAGGDSAARWHSERASTSAAAQSRGGDDEDGAAFVDGIDVMADMVCRALGRARRVMW